MSTRLKRIEKAQMRVLFTVPFFAPGVAKLPNYIATDDECRAMFGANAETWTACTNGERIMWCGEFVDKLSDHQIGTVLCHEVWHCLSGHLWRAPVGADWGLWNQATDHETNNMLKQFSEQVMSKRLADPFPFPDPASAYCCDPRFRDWAAEAVYQALAAQQPPGGSGGGQSGGQGAGTPGKGKSGANSMPAFGQMEQPKPDQTSPGATKSTGKQLARDWEGTLIQSAKMAAGTLPGELERMIDNIVSPKIDWAEVLRSKLREVCHDDWNWLVPALEYEESGFLLPGLKSEKIGTVVFGSDWSGSTFGELVVKFHSEKQNCLDDMRPGKLVDIGFDTRVLWEKDYYPGDQIDPKVAGGGGTSFVEVLKRCGELTPVPKAVVILTDLMGTFPSQAPDFPVIWVVYGGANNAPFGEVINAD